MYNSNFEKLFDVIYYTYSTKDDCMSIKKLMLILIILMQHCVFILSLFNYGEFIHQALNVCLPRNSVGRLEGRKISATSRLETNNFFEFGFVLNFLCVCEYQGCLKCQIPSHCSFLKPLYCTRCFLIQRCFWCFLEF